MPTDSLNSTKEAPKTVPRWLPARVAAAYSGMSRSKLYFHLAEGQIRAALVKGRGTVRGSRLFDRESIDEFLLKSSIRKAI